MGIEGLFRVSPQMSEMKGIMEAIERGLISLGTVESPHVVSGVIKQFLRDSPEPLLTFDLFDKWLNAVGNEILPLAHSLPPLTSPPLSTNINRRTSF